MAATKQRLQQLRPVIEKLMKEAGTAGLSYGVLHRGHVVHAESFGYRDVDAKLVVRENTIFHRASLTKAPVAAEIGVLVEARYLNWHALVKDSQTSCPIGVEFSTSNYWLGSVNNILIQREDILKFVNDQHLIKPFRGQFQYNNLGYETAGLIIEKLNNGKPTQIDNVKVGDDTFGGANAGMRSTVTDLLALYRSLLVAGVDQLHGGGTATKGSHFKQTSRMLSAQIPPNHTKYLEHSYAIGLARVQLPNHMGEIGLNPKLMPAGTPVVGKGAGSPLVIYHQGSFPGTLPAINLLPETQSAIVVLTNTLALNDCADWKDDYVAAARSSVQEALKWGPRAQNELDELKGPIPPRALSNYTDVYLNAIGTMEVTIILDSDKLYWTLQGLESEKYELHHLNKDVFHWYPGRNELAPYASDVDYNSSQKVRDCIPHEIQRPGKSTIDIQRFPKDIGCVYNECRDLIPRIWSTDPAAHNGQPQPPHSTTRTSSPHSFHIALVVHFGMRRRDNHIAFETLARKNVFDTPGLDAVPQGNGDEERWRGVPDVLRPAFDLHAAAAEVAKRHPDIPTRTSDDAGAYFCEYQLYSSLAYLHKLGEVARVVFMHVPKEIDEQTLRNDTAVAQTLIAALVDQDVEGRFKGQG